MKNIDGCLATGWYQLDPVPFADPLADENLPHLRMDAVDGRVFYRPLASSEVASTGRTVILLTVPVRAVWLVEGLEHRPVCDLTSRLVPLVRQAAIRAMLTTVVKRRSGASGLILLSRDLVHILLGGVTKGRQGVLAALFMAYRGVCLPVPETGLRLRSSWYKWTVDAVLTPAKGIKTGADGTGRAVWRVTGADPQILIESSYLPVSLPSGWYRMKIRLCAHAGHIDRPELFPDYGHGFVQHAAIRLPEPDRDGWIETLVVLQSRVRGLRFDPSMRECTFTISEASLLRINRLQALWDLLQHRNENGEVHWRASIAEGWHFLRKSLRMGVSRTTAMYVAEMEKGANSRDYTQWIDRYDEIREEHLVEYRRRDERLSIRPKISVLVPVYQTPENWLRRCLESVLAQVYGNWELCIANDASPSPHVREVLDEYARLDDRIRIIHRAGNGHISVASNTALEAATGEYVALLDHDDELRPHALLEMVEALQTNPQARFIYSDEDKLDDRGLRFHPNLKPDWNPDLLLSQNYICHLSVIETRLVREVGGFREGFEGSQDHDLFLRCTARLMPGQVLHVPKVLYHWRAIEGSTALARGAKDYAADAGARAVRDHLAGVPGIRVEQLPHGHYRVHWPVPVPEPKVSLIIPTRDRVDLLKQCIESIVERTTYSNYEMVIVDNQSSDPTCLAYLDQIALLPNVKVLRYDAPFNYSAINNHAVSQCDGVVLGLLNNDIEVISPDWLTEMVGHAMRPDIGAVGAMLYYPDDTIQHAGVVLGVQGVANHFYIGQHRGSPGHGARALVAQNLSAVTAACLVVRRECYVKVGGLNEKDLVVAFNDVDFCLRLMEAGYRNVWTPFAELYHHESASRGTDDTAEKRARFEKEVAYMRGRWACLLDDDPAYNPNLTLHDVDCGLAFPPRQRS